MGGWQELGGGGGGTEESLRSLIINVDRRRGMGGVDGRCWEKGGGGYSAKVALIIDITDIAKGRVEGRRLKKKKKWVVGWWWW